MGAWRGEGGFGGGGYVGGYGDGRGHVQSVLGAGQVAGSRHRVYMRDASSMSELDGVPVHLVVTAPPYWNPKTHGNDYDGYLSGIGTVLAESVRVLHQGRFAVINVANTSAGSGTKPVNCDVIRMMEGMGLEFKREIIWVKPRGTQGLWQQGTTKFLKREPWPCHPSLNIQHEYILIFQKPGDPGIEMSDATRLPEAFIRRYAWSVWEMRVSRTRGHPAPFPDELPRRIIRLFTNQGESVLDPFGGSGTTAAVCMELGRDSHTYEINPEYMQLIRSNLTRLDPSRSSFSIASY